jgi:DNA-binding MarR family transcriptional regulator
MSLERFYSRPGHLIRRLSQISMALFIEEAGELGVTARQFAALNMIRESPDIDQVRLSQMIAMDKTTIVKVIDRLVEKGLITRTRSPTDRRANVLNITPQGQKVLKDIEPLLDRSDQRILAPLGQSDQRKFMELLSQLVHVNNIYSRAPLDANMAELATRSADSESGDEPAARKRRAAAAPKRTGAKARALRKA